MSRDEDLVAEYEKAVGHPPRNIHADDPDWLYRGTRDEKDALKERVVGEEPDVIRGQESLFPE